MNDGDPHEEIVRLEAQIEALSDKIESCRKFILAGRIAAAAGGVLLVALLLGAIRFDLQLMMFAMAAFLGVWIFFPRLRAWMEMPKYRFLERQRRFPGVLRDLQPGREEPCGG